MDVQEEFARSRINGISCQPPFSAKANEIHTKFVGSHSIGDGRKAKTANGKHIRHSAYMPCLLTVSNMKYITLEG